MVYFSDRLLLNNTLHTVDETTGHTCSSSVDFQNPRLHDEPRDSVGAMLHTHT